MANKNIYLLVLMFASTHLFAQLTLNSSVQALQYAQTIVGPGFAVKNAKLNCPALAPALFANTTSNIGLSDGVLFTTGKASIAIGPNTISNAGFNYGAAGDMDLDIISKATTFDACVLEFDLIPTCDTLKMEYVFGSEEYPENIGKEFNDVFAFIISGPGIPGGTKNIALVPNTTKIVCVNTINPGVNPFYYFDNTGGTTIQYDGFTKPLIAKVAVQACQLYHLKIAIADVFDGYYDSGVFIKGNSIACSKTIVSSPLPASSTDAIKGCTPGSFTFCRDGDSTAALQINYNISGTAVNGIDYKTIANSITIPAGKKCANVPIFSIDNGSSGPLKNIALIYQYGACPVNDTIKLKINNSLALDPGPETTLCSGDTTSIGIIPVNGYTYSWSPTAGLSNPALSNTQLTILNSTASSIKQLYTLSASKAGECLKTKSFSVNINPRPVADFSRPGLCPGSPSLFKNNSSAANGSFIKQYFWNFGNNLFDTIQNPAPSFYTSGNFDVSLTVTDNKECTGKVTKNIEIWPSPQVDFSVTGACFGVPIAFNDKSKVPGGSSLKTVCNFGDNSKLTVTNSVFRHSYAAPGTFNAQLIITSNNNCTDSLSKKVYVSIKPLVSFSFQNACQLDSVKFINRSEGATWHWAFGDGDSSASRYPFHKYKNKGSFKVNLLATDKFGCSDSLGTTIVIMPKPVANFTMDTLAGCAPLCVNFHLQNTGTDSLKSWNWSFLPGSDPNKNPVYCFEAEGNFSPMLMVTATTGCTATIMKKNRITVYPKPLAGFLIDKETTSILNPEIRLSNTATNIVKWRWDFGDHHTDSLSINPSHAYENAGVYTLRQYVYNKYGCMDIKNYRIEITEESKVFIPNTITPNQDGHNDSFIPVVIGPLKNADFEMNIFNRWGDRIFISNNIKDEWDGSLSDNVVQEGVYVYAIYFKQKETGTLLNKFSGNVNVMK